MPEKGHNLSKRFIPDMFRDKLIKGWMTIPKKTSGSAFEKLLMNRPAVTTTTANVPTFGKKKFFIQSEGSHLSKNNGEKLKRSFVLLLHF